MELAFFSNSLSVVSLKYISPVPLVSTSAQNGAIKYLSRRGNRAGVNLGTADVNDMTPFVLIYRMHKCIHSHTMIYSQLQLTTQHITNLCIHTLMHEFISRFNLVHKQTEQINHFAERFG